MSLPLRTILALADPACEPEYRQYIATRHGGLNDDEPLLRRIRAATSAPLSVPGLVNMREELDPNIVAEYLDHQLEFDVRKKFEALCLSSDIYLAELASVYSILNNVLGTPANTTPTCRSRVYSLVNVQPDFVKSDSAQTDSVQTDFTQANSAQPNFTQPAFTQPDSVKTGVEKNKETLLSSESLTGLLRDFGTHTPIIEPVPKQSVNVTNKKSRVREGLHEWQHKQYIKIGYFLLLVCVSVCGFYCWKHSDQIGEYSQFYAPYLSKLKSRESSKLVEAPVFSGDAPNTSAYPHSAYAQTGNFSVIYSNSDAADSVLEVINPAEYEELSYANLNNPADVFVETESAISKPVSPATSHGYALPVGYSQHQ